MNKNAQKVTLLRRDCQKLILDKAGYKLSDLSEIGAISPLSLYFNYKLPYKSHNMASRIDAFILKHNLHKKHLPDYQPIVRLYEEEGD